MRFLLYGLFLLATSVVPGLVFAQGVYPSKPIRIVFPFPPGTGGDIVARALATELSRNLGVSILVENRPGAGSQIGTDFVAKSEPDGYTLLLAATHHAINPSLKKLPYDSRKDFTPIALVGTLASAIVVRPDFAATTLPELIQMAKQQPGRISFGSTGVGGSTHLTGEMLKSMAGIDMTHIPYTGGQQAFGDLFGGRIAVHIDTIIAALGFYTSGRIRILAVTSASRLPFLPNIPTVAEAAALPGFQAVGWYVLFGPAQLPANVVSKLSAAVTEELGRDTLKQRFATLGMEAGSMNQAQTAAFVANETEKWAQIIKKANIHLD